MGKAGSEGRRKSSKNKVLLRLLRQVRREAGLRQVDLAQRLGQPQSFVSKYESGERRLDLLEVDAVCKAVGISVVEFVRRFERAARREEPAGKPVAPGTGAKAQQGAGLRQRGAVEQG